MDKNEVALNSLRAYTDTVEKAKAWVEYQNHTLREDLSKTQKENSELRAAVAKLSEQLRGQDAQKPKGKK